jgi:hypothetical protein
MNRAWLHQRSDCHSRSGGVIQLKIQIPQSIPPGNASVAVAIAGIAANQVTVAVPQETRTLAASGLRCAPVEARIRSISFAISPHWPARRVWYARRVFECISREGVFLVY